jgi:DNA-binding transcriptional MerR regulator
MRLGGGGVQQASGTLMAMLTIKRLAQYVGVTVRAVRYYHQAGLLPEPERDHSGYRRYGAQAVIDLIRIKTLAEAGVPLARISELMTASPEHFARSVAEIDQALAREIRELKERRRRVAQLTAGERLFLPDGIAGYLEDLRALGISDRQVRLERDGWIMLAANYPDKAPAWIAQKRADLADPEFGRVYLRYDQAFDWDPGDPRLEELAAVMVERLLRSAQAAGVASADLTEAGQLSGDEQALLAAHVGGYSPAWRRLNELIARRAQEVTPSP